MDNKKIINNIYNQQSKEIKSWVVGGFIGSHHWQHKNYVAVFLYPLLFLLFIVCSILFGYELVINIMNIRGNEVDLIGMSSNPNYIEDNILSQVIPYHYFYGLITSIAILMLWWIIDLYLIEKKYNQQLKKITNISKNKSVFTAYLLWLLIGAFGAHRFYVGKFNTGLIFLFCTLTSWTIITGIVVFCWYILDVFVLHDYIKEKNKEILFNKQ